MNLTQLLAYIQNVNTKYDRQLRLEHSVGIWYLIETGAATHVVSEHMVDIVEYLWAIAPLN